MNFKREPLICTDVLPIDVTITGEGFPPEDALQVVIARRGSTNKSLKLNIVRCTECEMVIHVPPECARLGAGRYTIRVFDNCTFVCSAQLELTAQCRIDEVTHTPVAKDKKS